MRLLDPCSNSLLDLMALPNQSFRGSASFPKETVTTGWLAQIYTTKIKMHRTNQNLPSEFAFNHSASFLLNSPCTCHKKRHNIIFFSTSDRLLEVVAQTQRSSN